MRDIRERARLRSLALVALAFVQLTAAAGLVWRLAAREPAYRHGAIAIAIVFWCSSVSYPVFVFVRVAFARRQR